MIGKQLLASISVVEFCPLHVRKKLPLGQAIVNKKIILSHNMAAKKPLEIFKDISKAELQEVINFIDSYWDRIIHQPQDSMGNPHIIPLPNPYITTNSKEDSHWEGAMFYWDTYFMFRGIVATKRDWLLPKMVENYIYLLNEFGIIPNANKWAFLDRSQPPFLSSMIFDAYYSVVRSHDFKKSLKKSYIKTWLKRRIEVAKKKNTGMFGKILIIITTRLKNMD